MTSRESIAIPDVAATTGSDVHVSETIRLKLEALQQKLGADSIDSALDKSLNIAYFVADTLEDPDSKLLVERNGRYQELRGIA